MDFLVSLILYAERRAVWGTGSETQKKTLYAQTGHENVRTPSWVDKGNEVGIVLEPKIGVAGDVAPSTSWVPMQDAFWPAIVIK